MMHPIQKKLRSIDVGDMMRLTYRAIGEAIEPDAPLHPERVKHHIKMLVARGELPQEVLQRAGWHARKDWSTRKRRV